MFVPAGSLLEDDKTMRSPCHARIMAQVESKRQFVKDLKEGSQVDSLFSVKEKKRPRAYAKGYVFEVRISDRTGEITAKYWGPASEEAVLAVYNSFEADQVVKVVGQVKSYRDVLEIGISPAEKGKLAKVEEGDYLQEDFVAVSSIDPEAMRRDILRYVKDVQDGHLRGLLEAFFCDEHFMEAFLSAPASVLLHCNWTGGLAEHTLNVAHICEAFAKSYPKLDRDLLITGALLHDLGKVREYQVTTNIDNTDDGLLIGHVVLGAEMVARKCEDIGDIPPGLRSKVEHMVLSSHGQLEWGAAKEPMFPEAEALFHADYSTAKVEQLIATKEAAQNESAWTYDRILRRRIYLH